MRQRLILDTLPTFGGIFHILDKDKNILFIGRTGNIYKEINAIICSEDEVSLIIREEMASVRWEETPSDAISYLKYLEQIKVHRPILNPEEKTRRMSKSLKHFFHRDKTLLVVDRGRNVSERSVIVVEKGQLKGYTYCELNYQINNIDVLKTRLTPLESTPDNLYAIRAYIRRNPRVEVIEI
jgi:DNA polymerase-3 subunit epsilon